MPELACLAEAITIFIGFDLPEFACAGLIYLVKHDLDTLRIARGAATLTRNHIMYDTIHIIGQRTHANVARLHAC
eukprot:6198086-Pleurochrysis_carterae.AAC.1